MQPFLYYLKNPRGFTKSILYRCGRIIPDEPYLKLLFWAHTGKALDLKKPKTYNEKLQWLKLYNQRPEYTQMVDKYAVKQYVAAKIGDKYVIPTLGVWDKPADIEWDKLPNQFVLKTTHDGGGKGIVICKDKNQLSKEETYRRLSFSLNRNLFYRFREWPYKNVKKRILAEPFMQDGNKESLDDYKVLCFDGKVKLIEYHRGRYAAEHTQDFYDRNWHKTDITQGSYGETSSIVAERPIHFDKMIEFSEELSSNIPHIRVDWYIINGKLFFGELTFFDGSGFEPWDRESDDLMLGSWITLPERNRIGK